MATEIVSAFEIGEDSNGDLVGRRAFTVNEIKTRVAWGTDGMPNKGDPIDADRPGCVADSFTAAGYGESLEVSRVVVRYSSNRRYVFPQPTGGSASLTPADELDQTTSFGQFQVTVEVPKGRWYMRTDLDGATGGLPYDVFLLDRDSESPASDIPIVETWGVVDRRVYLSEPVTLQQFNIIQQQTNRIHNILGGEYLYKGITSPYSEGTQELVHRWEIDPGTVLPSSFEGPDVDIDPGFLSIQRPAWVIPPLVAGDIAEGTPFLRYPYCSLGYIPERMANNLANNQPTPVVGQIYNRRQYDYNQPQNNFIFLPGAPFVE